MKPELKPLIKAMFPELEGSATELRIYNKMTVRFEANSIGIIQHMAKENRRSLHGEINYILKEAASIYLKQIKRKQRANNES